VSTAGREAPVTAEGRGGAGDAGPGFLCAGRIDSVAVGSLRRVMIGDGPVCLARTAEDEIFAVDDRCSHEGGTLSEGELWGTVLECPEHYARFDLRTGDALNLPASQPVRVRAVELRDRTIWVEP
jgi:3-phenylpropionate/trans-cinnamate dioxygenase ferredoxin subunit